MTQAMPSPVASRSRATLAISSLIPLTSVQKSLFGRASYLPDGPLWRFRHQFPPVYRLFSVSLIAPLLIFAANARYSQKSGSDFADSIHASWLRYQPGNRRFSFAGLRLHWLNSDRSGINIVIRVSLFLLSPEESNLTDMDAIVHPSTASA